MWLPYSIRKDKMKVFQSIFILSTLCEGLEQVRRIPKRATLQSGDTDALAEHTKYHYSRVRCSTEPRCMHTDKESPQHENDSSAPTRLQAPQRQDPCLAPHRGAITSSKSSVRHVNVQYLLAKKIGKASYRRWQKRWAKKHK